MWKEAGMTPEDVGVVADIDEVFSRDFLRAVQTCDFPELNPGQSCQKPKICPSTHRHSKGRRIVSRRKNGSTRTSSVVNVWKVLVTPQNVSFLCATSNGDMESATCRTDDTISTNFPEHVHKSGRYPLLNGNDIRNIHGDRGMPYTFINTPGHGDTAAYGVAYHFHNWFTDSQVLRHKYMTYSHADSDVMTKTLSEAGEDLDILVRCSKGLNNTANPSDWSETYYDQRWNVTGPRPIFFLNRTYTEERHNTRGENNRR
jgi:hypothetical protein